MNHFLTSHFYRAVEVWKNWIILRCAILVWEKIFIQKNLEEA